MERNIIKTDTVKKVEKILNGLFFDSPTTLIAEFYQNAQRAKAKEVEITLDENGLTFRDDGCGIKTPDVITTLDFSDWESTKEGFGIGFWSCIAVPEVEEVEVVSNKFKINLDLNEVRYIINNPECRLDGIPVGTEVLPKKEKGFTVTVKSKYFFENIEIYTKEIEKIGAVMPFKVIFNGEIVEKIDIFKKVREENDFVKEYNTRLFKAVLAPSEYSCDYPELWYEGRFVKKLYEFSHINGIVEMKQGALSLKEPDRKSYVYDGKAVVFKNRMNECIKSLYKSFLNEDYVINNDYVLDDYSHAIAQYLQSNEYGKYLYEYDEEKNTTDLINEISNISNINEVATENILNMLNTDDEYLWVQTNKEEIENAEIQDITKEIIVGNTDILDNLEGTIVIGDRYFTKLCEVEKEEEVATDMVVKAADVIKNPDMEINDVIKVCKSSKIDKPTLKEVIKKNKAVMWLKASETEVYSEIISLAKYYGIKIIVAKNKMYENFLYDNNVTHIKNMEGAINKNYTFKDYECKNSKEESFLTLLEPIREHYKLPKYTFAIANIKQKVDIVIGGEVVKTTYTHNRKGHKIYGVTYDNTIIFDRKALALKKFNISLNDKKELYIGKNELKCLMYNMDTIAHELTHLLYNTVDNTEKHSKMQSIIQKEIIDILLSL